MKMELMITLSTINWLVIENVFTTLTLIYATDMINGYALPNDIYFRTTLVSTFSSLDTSKLVDEILIDKNVL